MLGAAEWYPTSRERPWGRSGELTVSDDETALGWTGHVDQRWASRSTNLCGSKTASKMRAKWQSSRTTTEARKWCTRQGSNLHLPGRSRSVLD